MEISSRFVGAPLKPMETQITWRQTTNYAAALGDANPRYLDDERPEGIVASPMFCVAVTWPISERIWEYIEAPDFPSQIVTTQVHYTEHLQLHRLVRPDDRLTLRGRLTAILPHKAGTLMVLRYDAHDQAAGDPGRVKSIACRFTGMVIPGSEIRVQLFGRQSDGDHTHLFFTILNTDGKRAVSDGVVTLSE